MSAPIPSQLDHQQCIQGSFDETTGRLRVDAQISASIIAPPGLEVSIHASDDNIAIRNTNNNNELLINADGSINVNSTFSSPQHVILDSGTLTTITNVVHIDDNGGSLTVDNNGTFVVQAAQSGTWSTGRTWTLASGTDSVASVQSGTWNINNISGTISLPTGASTSALQTTGNTSLASILTTLTDKTQFTKLTDGTDTALVTTAGEQNVLATAQPGIDIGDVTINNTSGAGAVNIQDGGNSITVDGTITANAGTGNFTVVQATGTNLHVVVDSAPTTSVTQGTSPWVISGSVTANAGTNLNTSALALDVTVSGLQVSQGSTTSGQKGGLTLGAVTTNAPTYTTAQSNPISLDTSGLLRISLKDTPANTNKFLVTADAITFASPQHVILDSGTLTTITNVVHVDDNSGSLTVDNGGTFAVQAAQSGTWTVQPGNTANTTPWLVTDSSDGSVTGGTVATKSSLAGGQYNTSLPTLTNGQQVALQVDVNGKLLTTASITFSNDTNYGAVGANTLRTAAQIGNATGAALFGAGTTTAQVLRVVLPTDQTAIPVTDNSGSLTVDNAGTFAVQAAQSGTWTVQPGNTANTTAWLVTGTGGTFPVTDSGGSLTVDNNGTFAVQASQNGTWNINNISGTITLPTGAATSGNQATEIASLASIDSKLTSPLAVTLPNNTSSASISSTQNITISCAGLSTVWLHIDSIGVGSGAFQGSIDGTNFFSIQGMSLSTLDGNVPTTFANGDGTVPGDFQFNVSGLNKYRLAYTHTSGTLVYQMGASNSAAINTGTMAIQYVGQQGTWNVGLDAGTNVIGKLGANSGVDIGDVTINNATGAAAVNVQDGGNSLTVDGTIAATQSGNWSTRIQDTNGATIALGQTTMSASVPVVIASDQSNLSVNSKSLVSLGIPLLTDATNSSSSLDTFGNLRVKDQYSEAQTELLKAIILELKSVKLALIALAIDGGNYSPADFNPDNDNT